MRVEGGRRGTKELEEGAGHEGEEEESKSGKEEKKGREGEQQ